MGGVEDTSARFTGQMGHTYAFFSVARDYLGHEESPPAEADAMTTLSATLLPELGIRLLADQVELSWPVSASEFQLETTSTLDDPDAWEPVPNAATVVDD